METMSSWRPRRQVGVEMWVGALRGTRPTRLSCGGKEGVLWQKEGSWEQGLWRGHDHKTHEMTLPVRPGGDIRASPWKIDVFKVSKVFQAPGSWSQPP